MTQRRPILLLALLIGLAAGSFVIIKGRLMAPPDRALPLADVDLHRIQGPWFEVARLSADWENNLTNPMLFVRYAGKGEHGLFPYSDPEDPRFRVMMLGKSESGTTTTVLDVMTDPLQSYQQGTVTFPCGLVFHCAYHLIAFDEEQQNWMVVAGRGSDAVWIFSRSPGLSTETLETVKKHLAAFGYAVDRLTYSNGLPAIPGVLPAMPSVLPTIPKLPVPPEAPSAP